MFDNVTNEWLLFFKKHNIFNKLVSISDEVYSEDKTLPPKEKILNLFKITNPLDIKVIIIGQDPYHTPGVANGIAFSTDSLKTPPSLKNIFKELKNDLGIVRQNNDLSDWVKQGVFLINTVWTVKQGEPNSHFKKGWVEITKSILENLVIENNRIVFCLWGNNAINLFNSLINKPKDAYVLKYSHPSPFSFKKGFENCSPFSTINKVINENRLGEVIKW